MHNATDTRVRYFPCNNTDIYTGKEFPIHTLRELNWYIDFADVSVREHMGNTLPVCQLVSVWEISCPCVS